MDGLKAINVYVISTDDGLVLIDGGWAIPEARELLDRCLRSIGAGSATSGGSWSPTSTATTSRWPRCSATSSAPTSRSGIDEKPGLDLFHHEFDEHSEQPVHPGPRHRRSGRPGRALEPRGAATRSSDLSLWQYPDTWLEGDSRSRSRLVRERAHPRRRAHARPHAGPLRLRRPGRRAAVRRRPRAADDHAVHRLHRAADPAAARRLHGLAHQGARPARPQVLPAHGPVAPSSHARVDELLVFHERAARPLPSPRSPTGRSPRRRWPATSAGPATSTPTTSSTSSARAWPRWRPRPTSSCSSPAASPRARRTPTGS